MSRPETYPECVRPDGRCGRVSCRHHLYLDVSGNGSIKFNRPTIEPEEMENPCVLEIVRREGSLTLDSIGNHLNVTRERIRQLESSGLYTLKTTEGVARKDGTVSAKGKIAAGERGGRETGSSYQLAVKYQGCRDSGDSLSVLCRERGLSLAYVFSLVRLLDRLHPSLVEGWSREKPGHYPGRFLRLKLISRKRSHADQMEIWRSWENRTSL